MRSEAGQRAFSVLPFQDVAFLPMLAAFPLLATGMTLLEHDSDRVGTLRALGLVETALRMGVEALRLRGRPARQAHRASRTSFRHDEDSVLELGTMRHDRAAYLSAARERISTLEELMLSELETEWENRDAGWDTDTLLEEYGQPDP